jgi:DNA-3-methyladenine glycosylase II
LAKQDNELRQIILEHGHPPMFSRKSTFETLIHIILEQQVSLASAKAALVKLKEKIGEVTPEKILLLTDEELRSCYFSRQKTAYARCLANAIINKELDIAFLLNSHDDIVRTELKKIKGIGDWTVDVFLMMCLNRTDCFPTGDIALMNSIKHVKQLPKHTTKEEILLLAEKWKPHRTIAAYILWWNYIKKRNMKW